MFISCPSSVLVSQVETLLGLSINLLIACFALLPSKIKCAEYLDMEFRVVIFLNRDFGIIKVRAWSRH